MDISGLYWDKLEDEQLKKLDVKYKMDIFEISQIQKRLEHLGLNESGICNENNENIKLLERINTLEKEVMLLKERVKNIEDVYLNNID